MSRPPDAQRERVVMRIHLHVVLMHLVLLCVLHMRDASTARVTRIRSHRARAQCHPAHTDAATHTDAAMLHTNARAAATVAAATAAFHKSMHRRGWRAHGHMHAHTDTTHGHMHVSVCAFCTWTKSLSLVSSSQLCARTPGDWAAGRARQGAQHLRHARARMVI
jgi:hypothetical protein